MDHALSLTELISLLCRTGSDPVLRTALGIDEVLVRRLRQEAVRDTSTNTSHKKFGIATAFGNSKMSDSIPCPPGVKHEIRLDTVFLYRQGKDRFRQYPGLLPFGIEFNASHADVKAQLGQPVDERGGEISPYLGIRGKRLKYNAGDCFVWFEFDQEDKLEMVAIVGFCYGS